MFPPGNLPLNEPFGVPLGVPLDTPNNTVAAWQERQQRQRNVRVLMMFIMIMLLMDGEDPVYNNQQRNHIISNQLGVVVRKHLEENVLEENLYNLRRSLDKQVAEAVKKHPKRITMVREKNDGVSVNFKLDNSEDLKEVDISVLPGTMLDNNENIDFDKTLINHYPRNSTGGYRGVWTRQPNIAVNRQKKIEKNKAPVNGSSLISSIHDDENVGVFLLDRGVEFVGDSTSKTSKVKLINKKYGSLNQPNDPILLDSQEGKSAIQLFSHRVPGLDEVSLIEGFIKLDGETNNFGETNLLLRTRGVYVHNIGKIYLVANAPLNRSVFYIKKYESNVNNTVPAKENIELNETALNESGIIDDIDDLVSALNDKSENNVQRRKMMESEHNAIHFKENAQLRPSEIFDMLKSTGMNNRRSTPDVRNELKWNNIFDNTNAEVENARRYFDSSYVSENIKNLFKSRATPRRRLVKNVEEKSSLSFDVHRSNSDDYMYSFPYVPDDESKTEAKLLNVERMISAKEKNHELNFASCEFEVQLDVKSTASEVSKYSDIVRSRQIGLISVAPGNLFLLKDLSSLNAALVFDTILSYSGQNKIKESYINDLSGNITSRTCSFSASVTASAHRVDWEKTKGRAINYSFYMMLTCLTQIVLLLRQLLHTQAQSAAIRVSLLCIGWQTVLDAILCIAHIVLCLAIQPLIAALCSVAFFKLLIFGVIEMKYMAIIVQARTNIANPNSSSELIRRKINMMQLHFYLSLVLALIGFWQIGRYYSSFYIMLLYSFWVPQILQNIITESKRPLHKQYIYGMSLTRLVTPLYLFAVPNNFYQSYNPDFQSNYALCQLIILWVGMQAAILIAQSKYGARFMIPARFLPPKYNYSRPIPGQWLKVVPSTKEDVSDTNDMNVLKATEGTRNRINGSTNRLKLNPVIKEEPEGETASFDCAICFSPIDVFNRKAYMLAPCDHLFHRKCLEQWMDVKMECPICRTELPSL